MPRKTPAGRVHDVARAACDVFIAKGYRATRLTDVAERLELSHALLYRYVESKEALVELAARYAMDPGADLDAVVPLASPPPGYLVELLRAWVAARATFPRLRAALERGPSPSGDSRAELGGVVDELYDFVEGNRLLLLLIESLADDHPELSGAAVSERKSAHNQGLAAFLARRAASGGLRPLVDPEIAAHFLRETIAWFAQHRQRDPDAAQIDDSQARAQVRELLLAAFLPDPTGAEVPDPTGAEVPGPASGDVPGPASGDVPGPASGEVPGSASGEVPGSASGEVPGPASGEAGR